MDRKYCSSIVTSLTRIHRQDHTALAVPFQLPANKVRSAFPTPKKLQSLMVYIYNNITFSKKNQPRSLPVPTPRKPPPFGRRRKRKKNSIVLLKDGPESNARNDDCPAREFGDLGSASLGLVASGFLAEIPGADVRQLALLRQHGGVLADVADVGAEGAEVGVVGDVALSEVSAFVEVPREQESDVDDGLTQAGQSSPPTCRRTAAPPPTRSPRTRTRSPTWSCWGKSR